MEIRLAKRDEISILTSASKTAFDTDITVGNIEIGGPPNYDSIQWHERMRKGEHLFTLIENNNVVGGLVLLHDKKDKSIMYVERIFIDSVNHHRGLGMEAMMEAERLFPDVRFWRLTTPIWNIRTNQFYPKLGYKEMYRDQEQIYYQKGKVN